VDQADIPEEFAAKALISVGSNATSYHGDPEATVAAALEALNGPRRRVVAKSRLYRTPFVPAGTAPDVINAAAVLETTLTPAALLAELHRIEAEFGRTRARRWGSRTLDLDLLMVGARILPDEARFRAWRDLAPSDQAARAPEELILPHPRFAERAFALVPAADVAPDWCHPVLGETVADLLAALPSPDVAAVRALG